MSNHPCALVEGRFKKVTGKFPLESFTDVTRDLAPHVGDKNDVLEHRVAAKSAESVVIPSGSSDKPITGDAMDEDHPGKFRPFVVSVEVKMVSPEGLETTNTDVYLRGQELRKHL